MNYANTKEKLANILCFFTLLVKRKILEFEIMEGLDGDGDGAFNMIQLHSNETNHIKIG